MLRFRGIPGFVRDVRLAWKYPTQKNLQHRHGFLAPFTRFICNSSTILSAKKYDQAFKKSIENPEEFWGEAAQDIVWFKPYEKVLDNSDPLFTKW